VRDGISRLLNNLWPSGIGLQSLKDERKSLAALKAEGDALFEQSPLHGINHRDFVVGVAREAVARHGETPHDVILIRMCTAIDFLLEEEGVLLPEIDWNLANTSFSYADQLRAVLDSRKRFFRSYDTNMEIWRRKIVAIFAGLLGYMGDHAFVHTVDGPSFNVSLVDATVDLDDVLDRLLLTYEDEDFIYPNLSRVMREKLIKNLLMASGIDPNTRGEVSKRIVAPSSARLDTPRELVSTYLRNTPFEYFFSCSIPFSIPKSVAYEHTHILGGTGHGKTQLLQHLIYADLERAQYERRSIVVIDSQGDLIRKLSNLKLFARNTERSLYDRFCIIDPSDMEYPVALNIFDINRDRIAQYGKVEREKILNGTIELYENFFSSLLGAELTQKQGVIFKYLARLMLEIPNANIHTLRDLMDDAEPFVPYMEQLRGSARYFFEREFFDRTFSATKKQISKRLWGVLATPSFERMFAQPTNKVDMFEMLNRGSIILINTAKDVLKQEGCELFGRFFLSMISQATMERAVISEKERTPTTIYIDEAHEYFDDNIGILMSQARKMKVGICAAHQTLDQLSPSLRSNFISNTSTKIVGGLSSKDAHALASDMSTTTEFLQSQKKRPEATEFALYVRHHTAQALRIEVALGFLEQQETLDQDEYEELVDNSRFEYGERYAEDDTPLEPFRRFKQRKPVFEDIEENEELPIQSVPTHVEQVPETTPAPPRARPASIPIAPPRAIPPAQGRGGREHRYIQEMVKGLAEQQGYLARIEEEVANGEGFVDVSLSRGDERIACEIAITTPTDKEIENIRKCFDAGYEQVWVIAPNAKHLASIENKAKAEWPELSSTQLAFLKPEDLPQQFMGRPAAAIESTVRGYRVRVKRADTSFDETRTRRGKVAEVLARSVAKRDEN
jgi:Type IV secretion-system coupling protein DNA-binding domain